MTNATKLADALVEAGIGVCDITDEPMWCIPDQVGWCEAEDFITDWRVAGAIMERACTHSPENWDKVILSIWPWKPRAVIEACVEALT